MNIRTNFSMLNEYVTMTRGDTLSFGIEVLNLDQNLDTVFMTCRQNTQAGIAFQKSLGNGITNNGDGTYTIRVAPEDTYSLPLGKYWYDLQIGVNGDIYTVMRGILELDDDITRNYQD